MPESSGSIGCLLLRDLYVQEPCYVVGALLRCWHPRAGVVQAALARVIPYAGTKYEPITKSYYSAVQVDSSDQLLIGIFTPGNACGMPVTCTGRVALLQHS